MNIYKGLALFFGLGTSVLLWVIIFKSRERQGTTFASFMIWGVLNIMLATSMWLQGGNYSLVALYAVTSFVTSTCLIIKQGIQWTRDDTLIAVAATLCMAYCFYGTAYGATIVSTIATAFGCLPQLRDIRDNPDQQKCWPWIGFGLAHVFSLIGGSEWSVPQRFYPACCLVSTAILIQQILVRSERPFRHKII
ncbi:MAG: hypothetical protein RL292_159 [Candidatus Parcubacteria bacterium]|jgi:hypothetical protein